MNCEQAIYPDSRVKVYFSSGFVNDKLTPVNSLMKPATVVRRYGKKSILPIHETKKFEYPDLLDVIFDHEPNRVSCGHFTYLVELMSDQK